MAILQPMRYKDYVWPHNPNHYTISYRRDVAVLKVPFGFYYMQNLGQYNRVMEGTGEFAGEGAYDEFKKLATVYYDPDPGTLVHPCWQTASAYFVSLRLEEKPTPDYVSYSFSFWERYDGYDGRFQKTDSPAASDGVKTAQPVYVTVRGGDTLWGIAQSNGMSLQQLLTMNKSIENPNRIFVGQKVRIA